MKAELEKEKERQNKLYEDEKSWQQALYDSLQGQKGDFVYDKLKVDNEPLKAIRAQYDPKKKQINQTFLSDSTSKGLRLTCRSTIDLFKHLLKDYGFKYVLTSKLNQDWLEVRNTFKFV